MLESFLSIYTYIPSCEVFELFYEYPVKNLLVPVSAFYK